MIVVRIQLRSVILALGLFGLWVGGGTAQEGRRDDRARNGSLVCRTISGGGIEVPTSFNEAVGRRLVSFTIHIEPALGQPVEPLPFGAGSGVGLPNGSHYVFGDFPTGTSPYAPKIISLFVKPDGAEVQFHREQTQDEDDATRERFGVLGRLVAGNATTIATSANVRCRLQPERE